MKKIISYVKYVIVYLVIEKVSTQVYFETKSLKYKASTSFK